MKREPQAAIAVASGGDAGVVPAVNANPARPRPFQCACIVGVGLMGGSLGMALRRRGLAARVLGVDHDARVLAQALASGAIDIGATDLARLSQADCVVFATPVGLVPDLMAAAAPFVSPDALLTDLGSVKARIAAAGDRHFGSRFIGGHPMAGSETGGIGAARPDLFDGAAWALIAPAPHVSREAAARVEGMVVSLGARPIYMTAEAHDHLVALVSHLPHVLSFAFARAVAMDPDAAAAVSMAGGSYKDLIRVSQSPTALWSDILVENKERLLPVLTAFDQVLQILRGALETGDPALLLERLREHQFYP